MLYLYNKSHPNVKRQHSEVLNAAVRKACSWIVC